VAGWSDKGAKVSNLWIRFADALSRLLRPAEREAVFGDFAELGMTDRQVVKSLLGLLIRSQLRLWREWNPWFAFIAVIIAVSPLLATMSNELAEGIWPSVETWLRHRVPYSTGLTPAAFWVGLGFRATALITWSWTSALAVGRFSRSTIWVSGAVFGIIYAAVLAHDWRFSVAFSWACVPVLMNCLFVLLPAYWGLRQSARSVNRKFSLAVPLAAWTIVIGGLALWSEGWEQIVFDNWSSGGAALTLSQLVHHGTAWKAGGGRMLAAAVLTAPIFYLLAKNALLSSLGEAADPLR
jgi:hypothetical protein